MYYKIENKDSELYQKLHAMRSQELIWEKENRKAITEKTGLQWEEYLGSAGQQNVNRVSTFNGFKFLEPEKVDLKTWKVHKDFTDVYVPNTKTKLGREMQEFLNNGLKGGSFFKVHDALGIDHMGRFRFPYVEITGDVLVIYVDDQFELSNADLVEITRTEFNTLLKS